MATATHIQKGDIIDFTATTDIAYLEVVPLANKIGIALEPIATGATGSLSVTEVWELPAAAPLEIAAGDTVYWNETNNNIDKVNQLIPDVSLDIADFKTFLTERKTLLVGQLKKMVI